MPPIQKIFLLVAASYLIFKLVLGFIMYVITLKVEPKGLEHKKRRENLLKQRRMRDMELYRKQYKDYDDRTRDMTAV